MSTSIALSPALVQYLSSVNPPEHPVLTRCRAETEQLGGISVMQISREQGAFMALMARLANARRAIEVGVFTGYSSLVVALAMKEMHGPSVRLLALDKSEEWTARARGYWEAAGVQRIIDLHLGEAIEILDQRLAMGEAETYDFAFIDADKTAYPGYYERCFTLLRPGGIMLFDNMLWSGKVADPSVHDPDTEELRSVARRAHHDERVHETMTSIGDGLLICVKR
jgi:predicted O-methyltransferase YrrM